MSITLIEIVTAGPIGAPGIPGASTEPGGTTNQVLVKQSGTDYDVIWKTPDASNSSFTSTTGITAVVASEAIDEVNTELGVERGRVDTNVTNISTAQDQADLGVANAATAQSTADDAQTDATTNAGDITQLYLNAPFEYTFDSVSSEVVTVTDDTYEEIVRLTTESRAAGTYKVEKAMLYSLNSTTTSTFFRFSLDGGDNWTEIREEPKDSTDLRPITHPNIVVHTEGIFDIILQARKENASDTLTIQQVSIILERKL